jgi:hypothetical protein
MKSLPMLASALALATVSSVAHADPRFVDPVIDERIAELQTAAQSLAIAQNERLQAGDWESAEAMAPTLYVVNITLAQFALNEIEINNAWDLSAIYASLEHQRNLADYFTAYDITSPFQTGGPPGPDPWSSAESAYSEFWGGWSDVEWYEPEPEHC